MKGYLVTFFTQEHREHEQMSLANWILKEARNLGVRGATLFSGQEGFGHDGRSHSETYFDLEDRPQQVVLALKYDEFEKLSRRIDDNKLEIFYTKIEAEFGFTRSE